MRSRTIGVDAMFSATAIIRWPRTSRNSPVGLGHRHRGDGDEHHGDDHQLEHQELPGQAASAQQARRPLTASCS